MPDKPVPVIRDTTAELYHQAGTGPVCLKAGHKPWRLDCLAGHIRFELRNVGANYPFERSRRFPGIKPNSGHRDYSRSSCRQLRSFRGITDDFDCGASGPGAPEAPPGVAPSHVGPPQAASRFQRARRVSSAESVIMIPIRAWGATARKVARTASSAATREDGRVCCSGSLNRRAIAANISKLLRSLNKPPDRLRPRLQDGARRYRVEAEGFRLPFRPLA